MYRTDVLLPSQPHAMNNFFFQLWVLVQGIKVSVRLACAESSWIPKDCAHPYRQCLYGWAQTVLIHTETAYERCLRSLHFGLTMKQSIMALSLKPFI